MFYDPALGVLQDYTKGFIQFGFLTLFVAACPLVRSEKQQQYHHH